MDVDDRAQLVLSALSAVRDRDAAISASEDLDFIEQDLDVVIPADHPLHSFAAWPNCRAIRGKGDAL